MTPEFINILELLASLIIGLVLLLLGRRVFWALGGVAVAAVGVVIAVFLFEPSSLTVSTRESGFSVLINPRTFSIPIAVGIVLGFLIGVFLTIRFPKLAGAIVGFVSGALILYIIFELFGFLLPEPVRRSLFIIAGTIVAIVAIRQTQETMIILSTLLGANVLLEVSQLSLNSPSSAFVWLFLMLFGIIFQMDRYRKEQHRSAARRGSSAQVSGTSDRVHKNPPDLLGLDGHPTK